MRQACVFAALGFALSATPSAAFDIEAGKEERCPSPTAVHQALAHARLDDSYALSLRRGEDGSLEVALRRRGVLLGTRTLAASPPECEEAAKTIAFLVDAWVGSMPAVSVERPKPPVAPSEPQPTPPPPPIEPKVEAAVVLATPVPAVAKPTSASSPAWTVALLGSGAEAGRASAPVPRGALRVERRLWGRWGVGIEADLESARRTEFGPGAVSTQTWSGRLDARLTTLRGNRLALELRAAVALEHYSATASGYTFDDPVTRWGAQFGAEVDVRWIFSRGLGALAFLGGDARERAQVFDVAGLGTAVVLPVWTASFGLGVSWDFL